MVIHNGDDPMAGAFRQPNQTSGQEANVNQNQGQSQPQGGYGPYQGSAQQDPADTNRTNPYLANLHNEFPRPYQRSPGSEAVSAFIRTMNEIRKEEEVNTKLDTLRISRFDGAAVFMNLSCIVMHYELMDNVGIVTLIVEGSGEPMPNRIFNLNNGERVEIDWVPGDQSNEDLWKEIEAFVGRGYADGTPMHRVGSITLPRELQTDDRAKIRAVMYDAISGMHGILEQRMAGNELFNVSKINTKSEHLSARIDFSGAQAEDSVGNLMRSDLAIDILGNIRIDNNQTRSKRLGQITAFIDLVYTRNQQQNWGGGAYHNPYHPMVDTRMYYPRMVMTSISHPGSDAVLLELQLLSLATLLITEQSRSWTQVFTPRYHLKDQVDLRDVGAIGFELENLPEEMRNQRIDTKIDTFTHQDLMNLIDMYVYPNMIYCLDVPETGPLSWVQEVFVGAAHGNVKASNEIIRAAMGLTNGKLANFWQANGPIFDPNTRRIHLGHYNGPNGEARDIRDIDHLAMLNIAGERDMQKVVDYELTFNDGHLEEARLMRDRGRLLRDILGEHVRFTGYAQRITFNPEFINALAQAIYSAGCIIRPEFGQQQQYQTRGVGNWANYASRNIPTPLFSYQPTPADNTQGHWYYGPQYRY